MNKHLRILATAVCGLGLLMSSTVWAGLVSNTDVVIHRATGNGNSSASGSLQAARNSQDTTQFIGCAVSVGLESFASSLICNAKDKFGQSLLCLSTPTDPGYAAMSVVMQSITDASFIVFTSTPSGKCNSIEVDNFSQYLP
jgi:hypothetical protein